MRNDSTTLPAIERVAVAILRKSNAIHPRLVQWIQALCDDPSESRTIEEFAATTPLRASDGREVSLRELGYPEVNPDHYGAQLYNMLMDLSAQPVGSDAEDASLTVEEARWMPLMDRAATRLAGALADHRRFRNDPIVDLAAEIATYHEAVVNVHIQRFQRVEHDLRTTREQGK